MSAKRHGISLAMVLILVCIWSADGRVYICKWDIIYVDPARDAAHAYTGWKASVRARDGQQYELYHSYNEQDVRAWIEDRVSGRDRRRRNDETQHAGCTARHDPDGQDHNAEPHRGGR